MIAVNKKDLIRINQEIGEKGQLRNESSLEFALSMAKLRKSWLYELAHLLRCLLVDHAFEDGNKRTALALTIYYFEEKGAKWDRENIVKVIHDIAKNNYKSIEQIARTIRNAYYSGQD